MQLFSLFCCALLIIKYFWGFIESTTFPPSMFSCITLFVYYITLQSSFVVISVWPHSCTLSHSASTWYEPTNMPTWAVHLSFVYPKPQHKWITCPHHVAYCTRFSVLWGYVSVYVCVWQYWRNLWSVGDQHILYGLKKRNQYSWIEWRLRNDFIIFIITNMW